MPIRHTGHWRTDTAPDELPYPPPGVRYVRVPVLGTVISDDPLRDRVDRFFHWPMIVLALSVLPLLAIEVIWLHGREDRVGTPMWWLCVIGSVGISIAFLVEFVIKITVAESRVEYVKRNWFDVIIIIAPFLRPFRVMSIARTGKVFKLRGVGLKLAKSIVTILLGLEAADRLMRRMGVKIEGRADPLRMTRHQLIDELRRLRRNNDAWERWYELTHGGDGGSERPDVSERPESAAETSGDTMGHDACRPGPAQPDRR